MKKSFKFSAILLALITSVSGLAPIGAVPPLKPDAKSEEKSKEMPQKRAREEEDSEELRQRTECIERLLRQYRKPLLTPSQLPEKQKELTEFLNARGKIVGNEFYILKLSECLVPRKQTILTFKFDKIIPFHLNEVKARYVESMARVPYDIQKFLYFVKNYSIPNGGAYRTPTQLTALTSFVVIYSLLIQYNSTDSALGYKIGNPRSKLSEYPQLHRLLAISKFKRDPSVPELDTDTPPEEFYFDTAKIRYNHDEMSIETDLYFHDKIVYKATLGG